MKKALGLWMLLVALIIGAIFFALVPEKNNGVFGIGETNNSQEISTRGEAHKYLHVNQITSKLKGETIVTSGVVSELTERKDTVFFTLRDKAADRAIKCVMFRKTNVDNTERKVLLEKSIADGTEVYLQGEVDIYKNDLEIKVWKVFVK